MTTSGSLSLLASLRRMTRRALTAGTFWGSLRWDPNSHFGGCLAADNRQFFSWGSGSLRLCLSRPLWPIDTISTQSTYGAQIWVLCPPALAVLPRPPAPGAHPIARSALATGEAHGALGCGVGGRRPLPSAPPSRPRLRKTGAGLPLPRGTTRWQREHRRP